LSGEKKGGKKKERRTLGHPRCLNEGEGGGGLCSSIPFGRRLDNGEERGKNCPKPTLMQSEREGREPAPSVFWGGGGKKKKGGEKKKGLRHRHGFQTGGRGWSFSARGSCWGGGIPRRKKGGLGTFLRSNREDQRKGKEKKIGKGSPSISEKGEGKKKEG